MKRFLKRFYVKWCILSKYKWAKPVDFELTESEKVCLNICRNLIKHPDSKFLIAPLSGKRYIKNPKLELFVILDDRRISLTNHVYHYDVKLLDRDWDRLVNMYDTKTEKIRQGLEDEIKSQINHSLQSILDKIYKNF